jgi:hypothetical protein
MRHLIEKIKALDLQRMIEQGQLQKPVAVLAVITCVSGLVALLSTSWSIFYVMNLIVHPVVAIVWCAAVYQIGFSRIIRRDGLGSAVLSRGFMLLVFGLAATLFVIAEPQWNKPLIAFGVTLVILAALGAFRIFVKDDNRANILAPRAFFTIVFGCAMVLPVIADQSNRWWTLALGSLLVLVSARICFLLPNYSDYRRFLQRGTIGLFLLATYSGLMIFALGLGREAEEAFVLHRYCSLAFLAMLALWLGAGWLGWRENTFIDVSRGGQRIVVIVGLIYGLLFILDAARTFDEYTLHLSTIPMSERLPEERITDLGMKNPELMDLTESCGQSYDCHPHVLQDHLRSAHNRSLHTPYFQKNLRFMIEEIGEENQNLCAGCHHPQSLFDDTLTFADFDRKHNYSCVFCHVVSDVEFPADRGRTVLKLQPNFAHLAQIKKQDDGEISALHKLAVNLYPEGHSRVFRRDLYFEDELCQACHRLQIAPTKDVGLMRSRCIDCHMQPRSDFGLAGRQMNHIFPGTNTAVPFANGDLRQVEFTQRFTRGEFPIHLKAWGQVNELDSDTAVSSWLKMHYAPRTAVRPGENFAFTIWTANIGVDHAFPAAPVDLIEVWLTVIVKDDQGREIFVSGIPDDLHHVPADAHRLGGYMIGKDGLVVEKNRVWQIAKKVIERQISFGERVADNFEFEIPQEAKGPLTVIAFWNYRKLNQKFVNWAYDGKKTMPITDISHLEFTFEFDPPGYRVYDDQLPEAVTLPVSEELSPAHP